jgi:hypothetical protein
MRIVLPHKIEGCLLKIGLFLAQSAEEEEEESFLIGCNLFISKSILESLKQ